MGEPKDDSKYLEMLERSNEEFEILVEIGKALTSSLNIQEILNEIMEKVSLLLKTKDWSFMLVDEQTGDLTFEIAVSPAAEKLKGMRLRKGEGIAGWVAMHEEPLLIPDVRKDKRFASHIDQLTTYNTRSVVCVPVKSKNRTWGVMQLVNTEKAESFTDADLKILSTIADYAAIAIENANYFKEIRKLIVTDDLTGLYNSRRLHELIEYEINRAKRYNTDLSLVFIDLDHFKSVNDTHGHLVGSRLLKEVGQLIKDNIRKVDMAARYGGDEFVLVLPSTPKEGAFTVASHLRQHLKTTPFTSDDGHPLTVTASFGIASFPVDAQTKSELVRLADKAMYDVKESTRDAIKMA